MGIWTNLSAVDAQCHGISDQIALKRYVEASKLAFQREKLSQSLINPPQSAARTANVSVEIDGYRFGTAMDGRMGYMLTCRQHFGVVIEMFTIFYFK